MRYKNLTMALVLTGIVSVGITGFLSAEETAPSLEVKVRDAAGQVSSLVSGQIQMSDALAIDSGIFQTADIDDQGNAFFRAEDFLGFTVSGIGTDGETHQVRFDGKTDLQEAAFQVQLILEAEGYPQNSYAVSVGLQDPVSYTIDLE